MWRIMNRSVREIRFVLKQTPEHHGVWNYVHKSLPTLRMLNQNTFFSVTEIDHNFETPSACHILYGDVNATEDAILSENLTVDQFEKVLKEKVLLGKTMECEVALDNCDKEIPVDIVESGKYVKYMDDGF